MKSSYWVILIAAAVLIGGYFVMNGGKSTATGNTAVNDINSGYGSISPTDAMTGPPSPSPTPTVLEKNNIVSQTNDPNKGNFLTDVKGMALYTFDNDQTGVSNCTGNCAQLWPPYTTKTLPNTLPAGISTLKRTEGTTQYTWKGMPVYYYAKDTKAGDTTGDGFGGVWHLIVL